MRAIGRLPLLLMPLALVVAVAPAFAMDQAGWQSATAHALSLAWVFAVGAFLADRVQRRRRTP